MVRRLAGAAASFLAAYENDDGDLEHDGESALLARLATGEPVVVVDVGANVGTWSAAARRSFPASVIHAFEPSPPTFEQLRARLGGDPAIVLHQAALGSEAGVAELSFDPTHPEVATLTKGASVGAQRFEIAVETGDQFVADAGIERIHLLKVDAEGHDLPVLRGFQDLFARGGVDMVQFEVTLWNAIVRTWVRDMLDAIGEGWAVGRIFPDHVEFDPYRPEHEQFQHRQNFLTVRVDRADLLTAAAGS